MTSDPDVARLGARIRAYRQMRRMPLRALAARAGASPSFISQLERGQAGASIGMLRRISGALGLTVADLFAEDDAAGPLVLRRDERPELPTGPGARKHLVSRRPLRNVEVYTGEFESGASTGDEPYTHGDSQEILVVLRGRVSLWLGTTGEGRPYELAAGDSIEYQTSVPHRVSNVDDETAEVMWIISPPTQDQT